VAEGSIVSLDLERDDAMVVRALRNVAVNVNSVYDLVNTRSSYAPAIPVLLELLTRVRHYRIKEGIARALAVKEARPIAARPLLAEFVAMPTETKAEQHSKWAIGFAISRVADDSVFHEVLDLLSDRQHGWTRRGMVPALVNMPQNRDRAVEALVEFLKDDDLKVQAMICLGSLRVTGARSAIEEFTRHPDSWVRQQAKRALQKLEPSSKKKRK
jgi:hypothetical protein